MSYIDRNLLENEKILYLTKRHWIIFLSPAIFTILGLFFAAQHNLLQLLGYIFLLLAIVQWISSTVVYSTSEFGVTDRRVLVKTGFIRRQSLETLLKQIAGIAVNQSVLGRMFSYGNIIIQNTGGGIDPFYTIDDPLMFRRKVQEQIEKDLR